MARKKVRGGCLVAWMLDPGTESRRVLSPAPLLSLASRVSPRIPACCAGQHWFRLQDPRCQWPGRCHGCGSYGRRPPWRGCSGVADGVADVGGALAYSVAAVLCSPLSLRSRWATSPRQLFPGEASWCSWCRADTRGGSHAGRVRSVRGGVPGHDTGGLEVVGKPRRDGKRLTDRYAGSAKSQPPTMHVTRVSLSTSCHRPPTPRQPACFR